MNFKVVKLISLKFLIVVASAACLYPSYSIFVARLEPFALSPRTIFDNESKKLSVVNDGRYKLITYINHNLSMDDKVLTFRQSDVAFYQEVPFRSHLAADLVDIYASASVSEGIEKLREFGITHLFIPNYAIPAIYNSFIQGAIGDIRYSTLIAQHNGYQLFALNQTGDVNARRKSIYQLDLNIWPDSWEIIEGKEFSFEQLYSEARRNPVISYGGGFVSDNIGENKISFVSARGPKRIAPIFSGAMLPLKKAERVQDDFYFSLHSNIKLDGQVRVHLIEYDDLGILINRSIIGHVLHNGLSEKELNLQFLTLIDTDSIRLEFELDGSGQFEVVNAELFSLQGEFIRKLQRYKLSNALISGYEVPSSDYAFYGMNDSEGKEFFISGLDSRSLSFKSPVYQAEALPTALSFKASGKGMLDVRLDVTCNTKQACEISKRLGTFALGETKNEFRLESLSKLLEDAAFQGDSFKMTQDMSYEIATEQFKIRLDFTLYIDENINGSDQRLASVNISDISIK